MAPIIAGANFDGLSPFGSRGVYDPTDVNLFVLLAYAGLGVFAISQLALLLLDHYRSNLIADRFIKISILTTIIFVFSQVASLQFHLGILNGINGSQFHWRHEPKKNKSCDAEPLTKLLAELTLQGDFNPFR